MMRSGEKKDKKADGILRVSAETKERLDQLRHPGQSYDGLLEEILNYLGYLDKQQALTRPQPAGQEPPVKPSGQETEKFLWWWPQADRVPGK